MPLSCRSLSNTPRPRRLRMHSAWRLAAFPQAEQTAYLEMFAGGMHRGDIAMESLLEASRTGQLVGAVLWQQRPGKSALVWPPGIVLPEPEDTAIRLLEAVAVRLAFSVFGWPACCSTRWLTRTIGCSRRAAFSTWRSVLSGLVPRAVSHGPPAKPLGVRGLPPRAPRSLCQADGGDLRGNSGLSRPRRAKGNGGRIGRLSRHGSVFPGTVVDRARTRGRTSVACSLPTTQIKSRGNSPTWVS